MLRGEDIICISWLVWDSIPLVMHQMMTRLAENNRVLFVDPPVAYSNLLIDPGLWRDHWQKTSLWLRGLRRVTNTLHVYYPPPLILQYGHWQKMDAVSRAYTALAIKLAAKKLGFCAPILWVYHPYAITPRYHFDQKVLCFDNNDDVGFFYCQNFDKRRALTALEDELTRKADVVFATSRHLYRIRKELNANTHYLPSGVDIRHFQKALSPSLEIAEDLRNLPRPRIGFVGGMDNSKMNWEWVRAAAAAHPQWSFVFVGPYVKPLPATVMQQRNVSFLGIKPMELLPSYLRGFDVCLIPYQGEDFLQACSPTKAFEYLAAGKPVVSAWIPDLEEYRHLIRMCKTAGEFVRAVEEAMEEARAGPRLQDYVGAARCRSWEERVEKASALITQALESGRGGPRPAEIRDLGAAELRDPQRL